MVGGNGPNARRPLSSNEHEAALFGLSEKCGHNLNVRDQSSAGTASDAGGGGMSTRKPSASASSATVMSYMYEVMIGCSTKVIGGIGAIIHGIYAV
jgi:hypothetical protein